MKTPRAYKQQSLRGFLEPSSPTSPTAGPSKRRPQPTTPKSGNRKPKTTSPRRPGKRIADEDVLSEGRSGSTSSNVGGIHFEPEVIELSDSPVDDSPKRPRATQRNKRRLRAESPKESSASLSKANTSSEDEEAGVRVAWKGKAREGARKRKKVITVSDSDEDLPPPPRKRKLVKGVRPPTPEEDDLLQEVDENRIIENRFRTRDKKSVYLQNLEKLKKRKQKQSSSPEPYEESDDGFLPFAGAKPHRKDHNNDSDSPGDDEAGDDEDDEGLGGFIEEDNNTTTLELPAEFSMNTYQDLMHHFKIICQLFVHLAVRPTEERRAFMERSMKDQYFSVPMQIARRKLTGMRDAIVTSSVWKPEYKKALEMYPEFETVRMEFAVPECDACHLGGRLSTIIGRVFGEPYDKLTFEPLESDDSSDEDDEEPELKKEFNLGRFCARRTRVFHNFTHWEYALFQALNREVEELQSRGTHKRVFIPVAYAGGIDPPEDLTDADGIMNWLDQRGLISFEWQRLKEMMESATNLEVASKRGDDDAFD